MKILVLGGTGWLGGSIAATALAQGHEVTCLARGIAGQPPAGAVYVCADRNDAGAYDEVKLGNWDSVVDVSSQPGQVRNAAAALAGWARNFIYISSCSVYADHAVSDQDENATLLPPLAGEVMETMASYGAAKVACEERVLAAFGRSNAMIVRAGLIGGPGDLTHRSGYWPLRFARPSNQRGHVLAPDTPGLSTQFIDVRDLAAWIVDSAEAQRAGIFNAAGNIASMAQQLAAARKVAGHNSQIIFCSSEWLLTHNVNPWMGERSLPLWLPMPEYAAFGARNNNAALAAGLRMRPLEETLADTLAWELALNFPGPRQAGLSDEDERLLLGAE